MGQNDAALIQEASLGQPSVVRLAGAMRARGWPIPQRVVRAEQLFDALRRLIAEHPLYYKGQSIELSVTIGMAEWPHDGRTPDELYRCADQRPYIRADRAPCACANRDAGATLLAGDFFAVNGELKMVVADATADGAGEMTLTLEPPLRSSPADNAAITLSSPTATFMLASDEAKWNTQPGKFSSFPVDCIEAWS